MFLMQKNPLLGQVGGGLALEIRLFWAQMALASLVAVSGPKKVKIVMELLASKTLRTGPYKS